MKAETFHKMHDTGRDYWWYQAKEELIGRLLKRYAPSLGDPPREPDAPGRPPRKRLIADIGCGTGTLYQFLSMYGRVIGMEPSAEAVSLAAFRCAGALARADSTHLPLPGKCIDIVGMFDCLEHMDDDSQALREARRIIRDDGVLIVTVPANAFLHSWRELQLGHKRRYSKAALTAAISQSGFRIVFTGYMYASLFPPLVIKSFKDRLWRAPGHFRSDIVMPPEPLNALLAAWFRLEARLAACGLLPFGTSLACVAYPEKAVENRFEKKDTPE